MKAFYSFLFSLSFLLLCFTLKAQVISGTIEGDNNVAFEAVKGKWKTVSASGPKDANGNPKKACTKDRQNDFKHLVVLAITYRDWMLFYQQYPQLSEQLKRIGLYREIVPQAEKPPQSSPAKYKKPLKKTHSKRVSAEERIRELEDRLDDIEGDNEDFEE